MPQALHTSAGRLSGKNGCSSGLVYRLSLACSCSVSRLQCTPPAQLAGGETLLVEGVLGRFVFLPLSLPSMAPCSKRCAGCLRLNLANQPAAHALTCATRSKHSACSMSPELKVPGPDMLNRLVLEAQVAELQAEKARLKNVSVMRQKSGWAGHDQLLAPLL